MCTHSCISLNRLEFLLKCSHWSICTHKIRYVRIFGWYTSVTKPPQCQTLDISLGYKHGKPESRSAVNITSQRSPRFGSFRVPQMLELPWSREIGWIMWPEDQLARFGAAHHTDPKSTVTSQPYVVYFFWQKTWKDIFCFHLWFVWQTYVCLFFILHFSKPTPPPTGLPCFSQYLAMPVKPAQDICLSPHALRQLAN